MRSPISSDAAGELVRVLIAAGCDMIAVGRGYVVNEPTDDVARREVHRILEEFGPRDHLLGDISNHLRSVGRVVELNDQADARS